jgi:hypothetical protein
LTSNNEERAPCRVRRPLPSFLSLNIIFSFLNKKEYVFYQRKDRPSLAVRIMLLTFLNTSKISYAAIEMAFSMSLV